MKKLIIIGASGFGREVAWLVERINKVSPEWDLLGFIDDDMTIQHKTINGYKVLGTTNDVEKFCDAFFICAVGSAKTREKIVQKVISNMSAIRFATLIDPSVEKSDLIEIGEGSLVCAHSILTVNISIGKHVIINLDCTVGHDAVLQDFVTLYPSVNISGKTSIGYACEMGTGAQLIQGKTVGDYSIVGAGAVVVKDVPKKCTVVGNPANPIKFLE